MNETEQSKAHENSGQAISPTEEQRPLAERIIARELAALEDDGNRTQYGMLRPGARLKDIDKTVEGLMREREACEVEMMRERQLASELRFALARLRGSDEKVKLEFNAREAAVIVDKAVADVRKLIFGDVFDLVAVRGQAWGGVTRETYCREGGWTAALADLKRAFDFCDAQALRHEAERSRLCERIRKMQDKLRRVAGVLEGE